jgi:hypothetical protein
MTVANEVPNGITAVKYESLPIEEDPRLVIFRIVDRNGKVLEVKSPGNGDSFTSFPMLINPSSMSTSMEQLVNPIKTIGGYVVQHWGHNLDTISANGSSPAFYLSPEQMQDAANNPNIVATAGLANGQRDLTLGYRNYKKLLDIFRHNGIFTQPETGMINRAGVGNIEMQYQKTLYRGYFENFTEEESEETPYYINYSFTYKVEKEISLSVTMRNSFNNLKSFRNPSADPSQDSTNRVTNPVTSFA